MATQHDGGDLAAVNGALSISTQQIIDAQQYGTLARDKRKIDFQCIDNGLAAAERLVAAHGADKSLPAAGPFRGATTAALLEQVKGIAALAAPYRPAKERRA